MKKAIILFFLIGLSVLLLSCSGNYSFEKLVIKADDVTDVPAGEYTLQYTIPDINQFVDALDIEISVTVFDKNNKRIEVQNNRTITVEADNVYSVTVTVSCFENESYVSKDKRFTVTAVKSDPAVHFITGSTVFQTVTVKYGESVAMSDVPEIPDYFPTKIGIAYTILEKYWSMDTTGDTPLTATHLQSVTGVIKVYGYYRYRETLQNFTIQFISNGGTEISPIVKPYQSPLPFPDERPVRSGYTFAGWFQDFALTAPMRWNDTLRDNHTLYAKWYKDTENATDSSFFSFQLAADDNGNPYYYIEKRKDVTLPAQLVLPCGYNNIPVERLGGVLSTPTGQLVYQSAFSESPEIESVVLPESIRTGTARAFYLCNNLRTVTFADNSLLTHLGQEMFKGCTALQSIAVPDYITTINVGVFEDCTALSAVTLSEQSALSLIRSDAFKNCTDLTELTLPKVFKDATLGLPEHIEVRYF